MTCLMDWSLSGALQKLHTSMLGTFFVYILAQSMPIFMKKYSQIFLGESSKLCIVVTLLIGCVDFCPRVYICYYISFFCKMVQRRGNGEKNKNFSPHGLWMTPNFNGILQIEIFWKIFAIRQFPERFSLQIN